MAGNLSVKVEVDVAEAIVQLEDLKARVEAVRAAAEETIALIQRLNITKGEEE